MIVVVVTFVFLLAFWAFLWERHGNQKLAQAVEQLTREVSEAQQLLTRRAVLAQEVAHEIKNPITAILCSAETLDLLLGESLDGLHRESLRYIRDYGDMLLRLVSDFLDVSCLETNKMQPRLEAVPLLPTVQSIVGLLQSNAQRKALDLQIEGGSEGLLVHADPKHLKQILFNLLHNALKFTPEGGQVRVQVEEVEHEALAEISITDNGPGIPAEMQPHLFDPYFRATSGKAAVNVGVGLGLTLARSLCEMGGGSLSCESAVGAGATFRVRLPRAVVDAQMQAWLTSLQKYPEGDEPLKGRRLLLLESDPGSGEAIKRLLEAWGGMVDLVQESTEAISALQRSSYDTFMVDDDRAQGEIGDLIKEAGSRIDGELHTIVLARDQSNDVPDTNCTLLKKPVNGTGLLSELLRDGSLLREKPVLKDKSVEFK